MTKKGFFKGCSKRDDGVNKTLESVLGNLEMRCSHELHILTVVSFCYSLNTRLYDGPQFAKQSQHGVVGGHLSMK